jgi:hypothetical protein
MEKSLEIMDARAAEIMNAASREQPPRSRVGCTPEQNSPFSSAEKFHHSRLRKNSRALLLSWAPVFAKIILRVGAIHAGCLASGRPSCLPFSRPNPKLWKTLILGGFKGYPMG